MRARGALASEGAAPTPSRHRRSERAQVGFSDEQDARAPTARVPLAEMFGYATDLRSRTQGRATYSMHFDRYEPAPNNVSEEVVARVQGKT